MRNIICDRCGCDASVAHEELLMVHFDEDGKDIATNELDLCHKCAKAVMDFATRKK